MAKVLRLFTLGLLVVLVSSSCTKLEKQPPLQSELKDAVLSDLDAIPAEYGQLKNITAHSMYDGWAQLWFEDEQQTIRMVRVNFHTKSIASEVLIVPRK